MARKKRYQWDVEADDQDGMKPSRSQKKRDSTALQDLGAELVKTPLPHLQHLPLTPDLDEALRLMARINDHEGRRRQLQYIGKLMRECEAEPIAEALARLRDGHTRDNALFHQAERLREALLAADKTEEDRLLAAWPQAAEEVRSLVGRARKDANPKAKRELFRRLRELLEAEEATSGVEDTVE